ncbi:hypothetical protein F6B93_03880 [Mycobacterium spongiae]|uniref:SEC-C motif-containing protein n=2 Tax=Mycobacterium spongiae TaxID=886343 RepID=A0A975K1Y2_9MYCO|nr:hypothetical protein F6B93_03880 [Mycobacterium spongiae]
MDSVGRPADALQEQAWAFLDGQQDRPTGPQETQPPPADSCDPGAPATMTLAWVPSGDYEEAVALWPELAEGDLAAGPDGPLPHALYCRAFQRQLHELSERGIATLAIAPVRVAPFTAWCAEQGRPPDSNARASYADRLAADSDPSVVTWPPGRNEPCWCGSRRKYKKCCAAPTSTKSGRQS